MKQFKRASISVVRQPIKAFTLFIIILILGVFASSAISIAQAIRNTEINLLRRIPPVAIIDADIEEMREYRALYGYYPQIEEGIPRELLETIGSLPYVRVFDYANYNWLFSENLVRPNDVTPYLGLDWFDEEAIRSNLKAGDSDVFNTFNIFTLTGIRNPAVTSVEEGVIKLLEGRVFTHVEMEEGSLVVLVSEAFADANQLELGSTFILESHIYETFDLFNNEFFGFHNNEPDAPLLEVHEFELEIIGIFTPIVEMIGHVEGEVFLTHIDLNLRLYVPISVVESSQRVLLDYIEAHHPESLDYHLFADIRHQDMVFALYDSLDLVNFYEAASALLPEFWMIDDFRSEFAAISTSLAGLQGISDGIVIGVAIASVAVLGLLILLFMYDRKGEVGIYLALGESRKNIIKQMLVETISVAMIALTLSLFIGNIIASEVTHSMLSQDLYHHNPLDARRSATIFRTIDTIGFSAHMTSEEMLAAYDVSLDGTTILIFIGVATGMIILSTILPIIYLTRLKPKDILIKSSIG